MMKLIALVLLPSLSFSAASDSIRLRGSGDRPRGAQCRKRVAENGARTCLFPTNLIREFGLVGGCHECGGLVAYQCVGGDMSSICCPPAVATKDTLQIVRDGSENTCTRVEAEEDIGVLAEKM